TLRLYNWQTLYSGAVSIVIAGGTAVVVYAGARAVMSGTLSLGQLIIFIAYLAQLYEPINKITQSWGLIAGARVGARRVFEVLDTEADLKSGPRQFSAAGARGDIAWYDVGFRYRADTPVLNDIDLAVAAGRPGVGRESIERAGRMARIHDMVQCLPEGYETLLGEAGVPLSEGEKQRITIARALLRDAPILILDEPTSALDVETEALVMEAIERLMEGRTTFIIAHRLSTVRRCDRIIVLRDGVIAEEGTLPDLLR